MFLVTLCIILAIVSVALNHSPIPMLLLGITFGMMSIGRDLSSILKVLKFESNGDSNE
jgi:hypothetical protein